MNDRRALLTTQAVPDSETARIKRKPPADDNDLQITYVRSVAGARNHHANPAEDGHTDDQTTRARKKARLEMRKRALEIEKEELEIEQELMELEDDACDDKGQGE